MSQNVVVTGTNSGFGRLITQTLASKGHQVLATMRDVGGRNAENAAALEKLGPGRVHVLEMSLTDDESVNNAAKQALDKLGHIDAVVNNAGYAAMGLEETLTSQQLLDQMNVNVVGPHRVMRAFLPAMRERKQGLFIQLSSGLGRLVFPIMGAYCASKSALETLSEAYRYGLKPTGVEVTTLQPGAFPTNFGSRVALGADQDRAAGYGPLANGVEQMNQNFQQIFSGDNVPDPQLVADAVLELVESPAGSRPSRKVVDPLSGQATETLNNAHTEVQRAIMGFFGMSDLAD